VGAVHLRCPQKKVLTWVPWGAKKKGKVKKRRANGPKVTRSKKTPAKKRQKQAKTTKKSAKGKNKTIKGGLVVGVNRQRKKRNRKKKGFQGRVTHTKRN